MSRQQHFNILPYWTGASSVDAGPFSCLSQKCQDGLLDLVHIFHEIDSAISKGALFHRLETRGQKPLLEDVDLDNLKASIDEFRRGKRASKKDKNYLLTALLDEKVGRCNQVWRVAAISLLRYQGYTNNSSYPEWGIAKEHSLIILNLRADALDVFEAIDVEFKKHGPVGLHRGIQLKFRSLGGFEAVYNRQPEMSKDKQERVEAIYSRSNISIAYSQLQQDRTSTLVAVVFTTSLLSFIPLIFTWHRASNIAGSVQDVDFWLLIQSSTMQLLGLFTAMFPIYRRSTAHAWKWAQVFTASGAVCSIVSIPLYLYAPTPWSALVSFFGSAAQAGMVLLLALMWDSSSVPVKKEQRIFDSDTRKSNVGDAAHESQNGTTHSAEELRTTRRQR